MGCTAPSVCGSPSSACVSITLTRVPVLLNSEWAVISDCCFFRVGFSFGPSLDLGWGCFNRPQFFLVISLPYLLSSHLDYLGCFFFPKLCIMENNIIRFSGKNFSTWEFQFKMFLKGKELFDHIDNSTKIPTDEKELAKWEV